MPARARAAGIRNFYEEPRNVKAFLQMRAISIGKDFTLWVRACRKIQVD